MLTICCVGAIALTAMSVYYVRLWILTPAVLAEYVEGKIVLYPTKHETLTVMPSEIVFVSQKNHRNRYRNFSSGILKIEWDHRTVVLHSVKEVESVRRKIEMIKNNQSF